MIQSLLIHNLKTPDIMKTKMIYLMILISSLSLFSCTTDTVDDDAELSILLAGTGDDQEEMGKRDDGEQ